MTMIGQPVTTQAQRPRAPKTPARYQRSGLAAEALRRALRQRTSMNMFGDMPGHLNDNQKARMRERVQQRLGNMRENQPQLDNLNPVLRKLFLKNRQVMRKNDWKPNNGQGQGRPQAPVDHLPPGMGTNLPPGLSNGGAQGISPPAIKINANGQLDLPYDFNFSMDVLNAQEDMNSELQNLQMEDQQQNQEYEIAKRNAGMDFQDLARQSLNNFAGRGMAFSSGYGNQVAQNAKQYNNFLGDLEQQNTLFDQDISNRRNGLEVAFNNMLRQAGYGQAKKLEGQAGDLGYGQGSADPSYKKDPKINRPKPKAKPKPKKKSNAKGKFKGRLNKARKDGKVTKREFSRLGPGQKKAVLAQRKRNRKAR